VTSRPSAGKPALFFSLALATILLRTLSIFCWLSLAFAGFRWRVCSMVHCARFNQSWSNLVRAGRNFD
jgi:hypothetical protein